MPFSSSCTASVNDVTNAFVAPYVAFDRAGLEAGERRDVEDAAPAARRPSRAAAACVSRTSATTLSWISRDLGVDVERVEVAERAEARVVHEHVDGRATRASTGASCVGVGEVGRRAPRTCAPCVVVELLGERLEPARVARDEHEVVAAFGELAGELLADPDRRAGDECDWLGHRRSSVHVDAPVRGTVATSLPFTTMRCAALCFGWHAISVTVGVAVGSITHRSVGLTIDRLRHRVDVVRVGHVEDDLVAGRELVEVEERMRVRDAVAGEHRVAALARQRGVRASARDRGRSR